MKRKNKLVVASIISLIFIFLVVIINFDFFITGLTFFDVLDEANNFKIGVFAICEEREDHIYCKDKVFASCNGELIFVEEDSVICSDKFYRVGKIDLEEKKFSKDWEDPREEFFLQSWAVKDI